MTRPGGFIELNRQFVPIDAFDVAQADFESQTFGIYRPLLTWSELLKQHRVVLLSSAGTGKTCEIERQCRKLQEAGKVAYFIRLEYLASGFEDKVFESEGDVATFKQDMSSGEEVWIFLDSIDEARLQDPKDFDKALRTLRPYVKNNLQNTHIILTGRVGAWRPKSDASLVDKLLPYKAPTNSDRTDRPQDSNDDESIESQDPDGTDESGGSPIAYYTLRNLTLEKMQTYAEEKDVPDAEKLISEIERSDLQSLAGRPKDLDDFIAFWRKERRLGKRLEIVGENIKRKLKEHDPDRSEQVGLTSGQAMWGAKKLAATVALTHNARIIVPDQSAADNGFSIDEALDDWTQAQCLDLLKMPIFEPEIYGFVRFDHRDSREFLAARWFHDLIKKGGVRRVENLFFKNQYGVEVVIPSLRPVLPWLALFDTSIRNRLLHQWPEILLDGGDPASLPLEERKRLLKKFCEKFATVPKHSLTFELATLRRLVSSELSGVLRRIHERYPNHDEIEQFVLQSIKLGFLSDLADIALTSACKAEQSRYTRIAAMEAIATVGTDSQVKSAIEAVANTSAVSERRELADFIRAFGARFLPCSLAMDLVERVAPGDKFSVDGLNQAMRDYVSDCSIDDAYSIICRTARHLQEEPFIEPSCFEVSKGNAWMLNFILAACERLVEEQDPLALQEPALSIMSVAGRSRDFDVRYSNERLGELIPEWHDLNAALFWFDIRTVRSRYQQKDGSRVTDWRRVWICNGQWRFTESHIEETIAWIKDKESQDDKMVALTLAFALYVEAGRPLEVRRQLWKAVRGNDELASSLKRLLNPPPMDDEEKSYKRVEANQKRRRKEREVKIAANRAGWRKKVADNLDYVRELKPPPENQVWDFQEFLFDCMQEKKESDSKLSQPNWQDLEEEFGPETAEAMRTGLMAVWRRFCPTLASEEGKTDNSNLVIQCMGLSGLEIESRETENWPSNMTDDEARHAARYLVCELNGFPKWFKLFERHCSEITFDLVAREAEWELFGVSAENPPDYVIHDLAWHAPWYGDRLASHFLVLLRDRDPVFAQPLKTVLGMILQCEEITDDEISKLCSGKVEADATPKAQTHLWYAAWVSVDPEPAVAHLAEALAAINPEEATEFAIDFINALIGSRGSRRLSVRENHVTGQHLGTLHDLMHEHIRPEDDIDRAGHGVYSPTPRDDAQDARRQIYELLSDIPGKETFNALMRSALSAPTQAKKEWLTENAIKRAQSDADRQWHVSEVNEFESDFECTPTTPRELFDLAVNRLIDLKHEYEAGDLSPAVVVIKIEEEPELRNYLAGELQKQADGRYITTQEEEFPNKQRTDFRFKHADVSGMVPVELKIADKWTGPKLFEKLRNQLCGDYLRDEGNKNGIFLLFSRGERQHWQLPNGTRVDFEGLVTALQDCGRMLPSTDEISELVAIENIEVVGVDLTQRSVIRQN